jgi:hypothetical protein
MHTRRFLIVAICALLSAFSLSLIVRSVRETAPITRQTVAMKGAVPAVARALRPNYPYSVIPGGAYSPAELRFANRQDALVRDHYGDFDLSAARVVTLRADRYQYVSYRLRNHIFWTRNRLRIPKGETLLTDGRNYARTRCGNRLSNVAKGLTSPLQPPENLLSLPPFRPELLNQSPIELASAPPLGELAQEYPILPFEAPRLAPYLPPQTEAALRLPESGPALGSFSPVAPTSPGYIASTSQPHPETSLTTPPSFTPLPAAPIQAEVPEPASLLLFGIALCVSGWFLGRMARSNHRRPRSS